MSDQEMAVHAAAIAVNYNIHDFIHGQKDCRDGVPHSPEFGESYDAGYNFEYHLEQARGKHGSN
jgi:hypothetical protein